MDQQCRVDKRDPRPPIRPAHAAFVGLPQATTEMPLVPPAINPELYALLCPFGHPKNP